MWTTLIYPTYTREPRYAGKGRQDNRHLHDLAESITGNMGGPPDDAKESGSRVLETASKSSDASGGRQRGHSTRSAGKLRTGGRATPYEVPPSTTPVHV